jgi:hypothetical protein
LDFLAVAKQAGTPIANGPTKTVVIIRAAVESMKTLILALDESVTRHANAGDCPPDVLSIQRATSGCLTVLVVTLDFVLGRYEQKLGVRGSAAKSRDRDGPARGSFRLLS